MANKRGDLAREKVRDTIIKAFGGDFITIYDKKIYVKAQDGANGEEIQFAITMTMPKTPIDAATVGETSSSGKNYEVTASDERMINALHEKLFGQNN